MIRLTLKELLDSKDKTRYFLAKETGIHYHIIDSYYKNKVIRYDAYVLDRICTALNCKIADLIEYKK